MNNPVTEPVDDRELLDRWSSGDGRSGNELVKRHFGCVYGFFRNKLEGDIDDMIQRTFLGCVESLPRFRRESSFRTYLFAIAHKQLLMYLRTKGRQPQIHDFSETSISDLGIPDRTPSRELGQRREQTLLLRAMRRLPLVDQTALELFYWENLSGQDIAEILELPHATLRTRLRRARQRLDELIGELGADAGLIASTRDGFDNWLEEIRRERRSISTAP